MVLSARGETTMLKTNNKHYNLNNIQCLYTRKQTSLLPQCPLAAVTSHSKYSFLLKTYNNITFYTHTYCMSEKYDNQGIH